MTTLAIVRQEGYSIESWQVFRLSFWLLPLLMMVGAVGISELTVQLDMLWSRLNWPVLPVLASDATLLILSAVMGISTLILLMLLMILGVSVGMTMMSGEEAHPAFGVMSSLMGRPGSRVVFGLFLGTVAFVLTTLYTLTESHAASIYPQWSVLTGLAMVLAGLVGMVLYCHRSAPSFQLQVLINKLGSSLVREIRRECHQATYEAPDESQVLQGYTRMPIPIPCEQEGYILSVDVAALVRLAEEYDLVFRLPQGTGQFLLTQQPLAMMYHRGTSMLTVGADLVARVNRCFRLGPVRRLQQDSQLAVEQLVEIAVRSLSASLSDRGAVSYPVRMCLDWLGEALLLLAQQPKLSPYQRDGDGRVRVIRNVPSFTEIADTVFHRLRQFCGSIPALNLCLLDTLASIARQAKREEHRENMYWHAVMIEQAKEAIAHPGERKALTQRFQQLATRLKSPVFLNGV